MLDGGPVRTSGRADRGSAERQQPTRWKQQPVEPQQDRDEPQSPQAPVSRHVPVKDGPSSRFKKPVIILIIVIVLAIVGWLGWTQLRGGAAIDSSKYQAVFFTNGQVYFGKLHNSNGDLMKLTDVYYLQSQQSSKDKTDSENPQATSTDKSDVQLIKLGNEIHGPENEMIISKDQVLFYENLKPDGKVSQSIQKFKNP